MLFWSLKKAFYPQIQFPILRAINAGIIKCDYTCICKVFLGVSKTIAISSQKWIAFNGKEFFLTLFSVSIIESALKIKKCISFEYILREMA